MTAKRATRVVGLLFAFAFAVTADPVSSVAYAIEAALRALKGNLSLLVPTMALVLAIMYLVKVNYDQLIHRFPEGGVAVAATGAAFGEAWAFLPPGALIVDFVLTIAISVAAAASAVIAYFPSLQGERTVIALTLLCFVAGLTWFGHIGRSVFATMTVEFIVAAGGRDQELVLFHAVSVFVSFLAGLLSMVRFSVRERNRTHLVVNVVGSGVVAFTILVNLRRGYPVASLVAALAIAGVFLWLWNRLGRPRGIAIVELETEAELAE